MQRVGMRITPDACTLLSSSKSPMLGARAFTSAPSWISQPTEAQRTAVGGSSVESMTQAELGWRLSSHSITTNGHRLIWQTD